MLLEVYMTADIGKSRLTKGTNYGDSGEGRDKLLYTLILALNAFILIYGSHRLTKRKGEIVT